MTGRPARFVWFSWLLVGGLSVGCGSDEAIFAQPNEVPDSGDEGQNPNPGPVTPQPTATSVSPGPTSTAPTGPATSALGAPCASDSQCGQGMICITSAADDFIGGGPANGFCTVDCTASVDDSDCEAVQAGSVCIPTGQRAHCMPSCSEGIDPGNKCKGRDDVACDFFRFASYGVSYCRPTCGSDADCDGRLCDLGLGTCVDELPGQDPLGSACDPNAGTNSCASGTCIRGTTPATTNSGVCTGICTLGAIGCGETQSEPSSPGAPFCAPFLGNYSGVGDAGLCLQSCGCDDDCLSPDYKCLRLPDDVAAAFGVGGMCFEHDNPIGAEPGFVLGVACPAGPDGGPGDAGGDAATSDGGPRDAASTDGSTVTELDSATSGLDAAQGDSASMSLNPDATPLDAQ